MANAKKLLIAGACLLGLVVLAAIGGVALLGPELGLIDDAPPAGIPLSTQAPGPRGPSALVPPMARPETDVMMVLAASPSRPSADTAPRSAASPLSPLSPSPAMASPAPMPQYRPDTATIPATYIPRDPFAGSSGELQSLEQQKRILQLELEIARLRQQIKDAQNPPRPVASAPAAVAPPSASLPRMLVTPDSFTLAGLGQSDETPIVVSTYVGSATKAVIRYGSRRGTYTIGDSFGAWKIVSIVVDGVLFVRNGRNQFIAVAGEE